jgi:hypothetical protein
MPKTRKTIHPAARAGDDRVCINKTSFLNNKKNQVKKTFLDQVESALEASKVSM